MPAPVGEGGDCEGLCGVGGVDGAAVGHLGWREVGAVGEVEVLSFLWRRKRWWWRGVVGDVHVNLHGDRSRWVVGGYREKMLILWWLFKWFGAGKLVGDLTWWDRPGLRVEYVARDD